MAKQQQATSTQPQAKPRSKFFQLPSDSAGSFLYFVLFLVAALTPLAFLLEFGLLALTIILFFMVGPCIGFAAGFFMKKYRTPKNLRELERGLKQGAFMMYHIGRDGVARLVPFSRGGTGLLHGPNMEITPTEGTIWPFMGSNSGIVHSMAASTLGPEFLYQSNQLLQNIKEFEPKARQIGYTGRLLDTGDLMDYLAFVDKKEEWTNEVVSLAKDIDAKNTTLVDFLMKRYPAMYYDAKGDPITSPSKARTDMEAVWTDYVKNGATKALEELKTLKSAKELTIKELGNFRFEVIRDEGKKIVGGLLIHDRVLTLDGFRRALPTGGTAEDSYTQMKHSSIGNNMLEGNSMMNHPMIRLLLYIMPPIGIGIMLYLVFLGLKALGAS